MCCPNHFAKGAESQNEGNNLNSLHALGKSPLRRKVKRVQSRDHSQSTGFRFLSLTRSGFESRRSHTSFRALEKSGEPFESHERSFEGTKGFPEGGSRGEGRVSPRRTVPWGSRESRFHGRPCSRGSSGVGHSFRSHRRRVAGDATLESSTSRAAVTDDVTVPRVSKVRSPCHVPVSS
jgi:hypothetical protein